MEGDSCSEHLKDTGNKRSFEIILGLITSHKDLLGTWSSEEATTVFQKGSDMQSRVEAAGAEVKAVTEKNPQICGLIHKKDEGVEETNFGINTLIVGQRGSLQVQGTAESRDWFSGIHDG